MGSQSANSKNILLVFDFDWTFVDEDTDTWTCRLLADEFKEMMRQLHLEETTGLEDGIQWTDLIAHMMRKLHQAGFTKEQIIANLETIPFNPAMKRATQSLKARPTPSTTFFCLSNANVEFIRIVLSHHGLSELFDQILSNPASWNEEGCLEIKRYVEASAPVQHTCDTKPRKCSPNMCKGLELETFLSQKGGFERFDQVIYLGDGANDLCPILRLRPCDLALVRSGRALAKLYPASQVKCQVEEWAEADDVEKIFARYH
ncbi:hypothetical protein T439DRAFT_323486 [Meredithblackwellia eburnea MCA 4105]